MDVFHYITKTGKNLFLEWLDGFEQRDLQAAVKAAQRVDRLVAGNFGDCKALRDGVWELRIDHGPGYRIYYGMIGRTCVLLLCGGDKRRQTANIDQAVQYWHDYKERIKP